MSASTTVFVVALAIAGCGGASPPSPGPVAPTANGAPASSNPATVAELELRFDETAAYEDLELRWLELEDSRCPIGVVCVWAGQIVVTLEAARAVEVPVEVELVLRVGSEPESAPAFGYTLRLQGVDPHPKEGVTPERGDYVARVEIAGP